MKHAFNIHPSLLIITPMMNAETMRAIDDVAGNDCLFDENRTQPMLRCNVDMDACLLLELLDERLIQLKPMKFRGKRYAITYIPVLN